MLIKFTLLNCLNDGFRCIVGEIQCEQLNNSLYTFTGNLMIQNQTLPLSPNQLLLRVCTVDFFNFSVAYFQHTARFESKRNMLCIKFYFVFCWAKHTRTQCMYMHCPWPQCFLRYSLEMKTKWRCPWKLDWKTNLSLSLSLVSILSLFFPS